MRLFDNNNIKTYKKQARVALEGFIAEFANFLPVLITAIGAGTLLVWSDTFVSFSAMLHYILVLLVSLKLKKDTGDKYNFGVGRLEVLTSFICDILLILGYVVFAGISIYGLIYPSQPEDALFWFLILKACNITFDSYFYIKQLRLRKANGTRMNDTEVANCLNALLIDIVTGVTGCLCYFLRGFDWAWYISPAATLIMSITFFIQTFKRIKESIGDLVDVSIPLDQQDELFDIVLENGSMIEKIYEVNCRMLNKKLYVDIDLSFKENVFFTQEKELLQNISQKVLDRFPKSHTRFIVDNKNEK